MRCGGFARCKHVARFGGALVLRARCQRHLPGLRLRRLSRLGLPCLGLRCQPCLGLRCQPCLGLRCQPYLRLRSTQLGYNLIGRTAVIAVVILPCGSGHAALWGGNNGNHA